MKRIQEFAVIAALAALFSLVLIGFTDRALAQPTTPTSAVRLFATHPTTGAAVHLLADAVNGLKMSVTSAAPGTRFHCVVPVSTATTIQAVGGSCAAPGATNRLYITDIYFSASASGIAADAFPTLKSGTGGTCGTATTVVWQHLSASAVNAVDNRSQPIPLTLNHELCWITSTAGSKALQVSGYIAP